MKKKNKSKFKVLIPVKIEKQIPQTEKTELPDIKSIMVDAEHDEFWSDSCWRMIS